MRTHVYKERDDVFGRTMITLRTAMGLTQVDLAQFLNVSRHAVQGWEGGISYPKSEHLKFFISCCVEHCAFVIGHEEEEIHTLWLSARQKVLLDEHWLFTLLHQQSLPSRITLAPVERTRSQDLPASKTGCMPRVDWNNALYIPSFYGRKRELSTLKQWIVWERCRVVSVLGMGGIGKSALVTTFAHRVAEYFDVVLYRSLRDVSSCEELVVDLLKVLSSQMLTQEPTNFAQHLHLLLKCLREQRVLLVLDNLETLVQEGDREGHYRPGYEGFKLLLRLAGETMHQSCWLLTSREKLTELVPLEGTYTAVRALHLSRLELSACEQLFAEREVLGTPEERARLVETYAGNPFALKIVAETIADIFAGEISSFFAQGSTIFGGIGVLIAEQVNWLSAFEQKVLHTLVIAREPLNLQELAALMIVPQPPGGVLAAIDILRRRSLIERGYRPGSVQPHSLVMAYMTGLFIEAVTGELERGSPALLIEYGLCRAAASEEVRQAQERELIVPMVRRLRSLYPGRGETERHLLTILNKLRERHEDAQGYGPTNIVVLLRVLCGHLRGLDLSHLVLRGAYLQGTSLVGATVCDSVDFTPDSQMQFSASEDGSLRVWDVERGQGTRMMQGHAACLYDVAWSPDGTRIASAGSDWLVLLWNLSDGIPPRVLRGHHWSVDGVSWSPDGKMLASSGWDNAIRLWDPDSSTCLQVLNDVEHPDTVFRGVSWSPNGRWLAGGSHLHEIQVWDMETGRRHCIARALPTIIRRIAWSPDGMRLVSGGMDGNLYVWGATDDALLSKLQGHHSLITSVVWSPDGTRLASGGGGELFLWDAYSGERLRTFAGVPRKVLALEWNPRGELLVSGSSDGMLQWWDVHSGECVRIQEAHQGAIQSLKISPDGCYLASCGDDGSIQIRDLESGALRRTLRRDRPCERLNITDVRGLTQAQKSTLRALGALEENACFP